MKSVKLALWQFPTLSQARWQELYDGLPRDKKLYATRYKSLSRRRSFIAGHHLLHKTVALFEGRDRTFRSTYGAEWELHAELPSADLSGGISHSQNMITCVVSDGFDSGIDIEAPALRQRNYAALVENFFADSERLAFASVSPQEQQLAFLSLWTLKESWLKAQGLGVSSAGLITEFLPLTETEKLLYSSPWMSRNFFWRGGVGAVTVASTLAELEITGIHFYQMDHSGEALAAISPPVLGPWRYAAKTGEEC